MNAKERRDGRVLVGFRVAPEIERRIRVEAARNGKSKSEYLAALVIDYLATAPQNGKASGS